MPNAERLTAQAVTDAYNVLSSDQLRSRYDQLGYAGLRPEYAKYAAYGASLEVDDAGQTMLSNQHCVCCIFCVAENVLPRRGQIQAERGGSRQGCHDGGLAGSC